MLGLVLALDKNVHGNLICKWGFDENGGHCIYKQRLHDDESTDEYR